MAVNINKVYQRVLAIANKEQRGYITPQEFNMFAAQAQLEIFEQYFYDINQFGRLHGNDTEYSDMLNILEEKLAAFEKFKIAMSAMSGNQATLPTDVYRLGTVFYAAGSFDVEVEKVKKKELEYMLRTALAAPTDSRPVYARKNETLLKIFPSSPSTSYTTANITCNYVAKPTNPVWGYNVVVNKPLYNSATSTNFELHESEENTLVYSILLIAGIAIEAPGVTQVAMAKLTEEKQQEKN